MNLLAEFFGIKPSSRIDKYFKVKFTINKTQEFKYDNSDDVEKYKRIRFKIFPESDDFYIEIK